jgi:O-antigen/teichoic acid export membrane protein
MFEQGIKKGVAPQLVGAVTNALVGALLMVFLARWLGPSMFSDYVALLAAATIGLVVIEGGLPTLRYREGVRTSERLSLDSNRLTALASTHFLLSGAMLCAVLVAWRQETPWVAIAAAGCMVGVAACNFVSAGYRASNAFTRDAIWQVLVRALSASAVAIVVYKGAGVTGVFFAWGGALALALALRKPAMPFSLSLAGYGRMLANMIPLFSVEALTIALSRIDVVLLSCHEGLSSEMSGYVAATRFTELALLLWASVLNVSFGWLRAAPSVAAMRSRSLQLVVAALFVGLIFYAGVTLLGPMAIVFLFGDNYQHAVGLLPRVALAIPAAMVALAGVQGLVASERNREALLALLLGMACLLIGWQAFGGPNATYSFALVVAAAHTAVALTSVAVLSSNRSS